MFCTVNEHLDKEEGIQCLKANCAFKHPFLLFCAHFFPSETLHFTSDFMFLKFCLHRKDSALQLCTAELPLELHMRGLVVFWPFIHWIFSSLFSTQKSMYDEQLLSMLKNNENKESWHLTTTSSGKSATNHLCLQTFLFVQAVVPWQHKQI